ncbi:MAG: response regulator, partial [bacterium]
MVESQGQMILLVEDNQDDQAFMRRAFRKNQIANQLIITQTGEEALDFLFGTGAYADRDIRVIPTLVLLDLNLPRIDGLEVLRQIRARGMTKLLPVVVLTSSKEDKDVRTSYELGANSYVHKPVGLDEFAHAVHAVSLFWLHFNVASPIP